jgi:hypothetical protein
VSINPLSRWNQLGEKSADPVVSSPQTPETSSHYCLSVLWLSSSLFTAGCGVAPIILAAPSLGLFMYLAQRLFKSPVASSGAPSGSRGASSSYLPPLFGPAWAMISNSDTVPSQHLPFRCRAPPLSHSFPSHEANPARLRRKHTAQTTAFCELFFDGVPAPV